MIYSLESQWFLPKIKNEGEGDGGKSDTKVKTGHTEKEINRTFSW